MATAHPDTIKGLIVHKLIKERQGIAEIVPRAAAVVVTNTVQRLIEQIHLLYSEKQSKGYGKFQVDEDNFPMGRYARNYFVDTSLLFYDLSISMMRTLKRTADNAPLSTGGYVLIAHVFNGATDFLLVALVTDVLGTAITDGLEIVDSTHLDISNLRVAGRIDLTAWQAGAERYVSFLKGKGEVADYFKEFLGCDDVVSSNKETQKLITCLQRFAETNTLVDAARDRLFQQAYDWCAGLASSKTPIDLEALANYLWPTEPGAMRAAMAHEELQLSDGFVPDKRALRAFVKFSAKTAFWRLEFERSGLRNGQVDYDKEAGTLLLRGLPQSLLDELNLETADD